MKTKVYLQCGYEDKCKKKNCIDCGFQKKKYNLNLSLAECITIEDFAVCDLKSMLKEKPEEVELMQKIMIKLMKKVYKND